MGEQTQEIIRTNHELRKQLAEDDILIDEYKSRIRILERDLDYCNREIEHLGNTLIYSEEEIESLKRLNSNLSKQLRKALKEVEWKEECLVSRDNQIFSLESKILTLKIRIKEITKKQTMAGNVQPTTSELDNAFNTIQSAVDAIRNHFTPLPGRSPSRFNSGDILRKFAEISDNAYRLNEVAKWYIGSQTRNQVDARVIVNLTNERDTAQRTVYNKERRMINLLAQLDTANASLATANASLDTANASLDAEHLRYEQTVHDHAIQKRKYKKWKARHRDLETYYNNLDGNFDKVYNKNNELDRKLDKKRTKYRNAKQRIRHLEYQVNQQVNQVPLPVNMAQVSSVDAKTVIAPELAKIPSYTGQETPHDFIRKIDQVLESVYNCTTDGNAMANDRGNASITPLETIQIYKSKMGGKFAPVPDQYPVGTAINTIQLFMNWLNDKFRNETIGTMQSALIGLMQEQFSPFDNPDTFERKVRPYLIGLENATVVPILLSKLPENLEMRVRHVFDRRNANQHTVDNFFIDLKNGWMQRRPDRGTNFQPMENQNQRFEAPPLQQPVIQQPVIQQPVYHKVDPKAFVEDTYGKGTWNLDSRVSDTYNTTRDIIKRGQDIQAFNQGNNRDIDSIIERAVQKRIELESNPKFEKINRYRNIIENAQRGIENEENRPDDPMDIDYIIANLAKGNHGVKTKRTVNRTKGKSKKTKPKKKTKTNTKKKVRHIYVNGEEEVEESSSSEEGDSSSSEEGDSSDEEQYYVNSAKKKLM